MPVIGEKSKRSFFTSRWFVIVGVAFLVLVAVNYGRAYYRQYQIQQEIERLRAEADRLTAKKMETLEMLDYVKSKDYVEAQARNELNLVKPGERVAVILGNEGKPASGQKLDTVVESENISNFIRWWYYFFGKK